MATSESEVNASASACGLLLELQENWAVTVWSHGSSIEELLREAEGSALGLSRFVELL